MTESRNVCHNCILPHGFLGIKIDSDGLCNYCRDPTYKTVNWSKVQTDEALRQRSLEDWNKTINYMLKNHGRQDYDCVLGYSGGKDSTALIDKFVYEYKLKPLLVTVDTGFMTDIAKQNVKNTLSKMDIYKDWVLIEDAIQTFAKLYKYLFFNHRSNEKTLTVRICALCTDLIHTIIVKEAIKRGISYVIIGLSPDQIKRYFYETPKKDIIKSGVADAQFNEEFDATDQKWFLTKDELTSGYIPRVLYPYHVIKYDENEIINRIESKGLIDLGKGDPTLTNCYVVKAALMYDLYRYGGLTYILQYAELVRQQKKEEERIKCRRNWLRIYNQVSRGIFKGTFDAKGMKIFFDYIGLSKKALLKIIIEQRRTDPNKEQILKNLELLQKGKLK